jgi:hypothetical protein
MQRCDFYENFSYTVETSKRQIGPLADIALLNGWGKLAVEVPFSTSPKRVLIWVNSRRL